MGFNLNMKPVSGTVNFHGSSFSGADIKLMVYCNHPNILKRRKEAELESIHTEYARLIEQVKTVTNPSEIEMLQDSIAALLLIRERIYKTQIGQSGGLITLATVSSLSIQAYREKVPVRALGCTAPKGFTRGARTVAGSLVFAQFDEHALADFLYTPPTEWAHENIGSLTNPDQLPPMTIVAQFANEYGTLSELSIMGLEFVDDGLVLSIEDIYTEGTCTYVARDYNVLMKRGDVALHQKTGGQTVMATTASALIRNLKNDSDYIALEKQLNVRRRDPYR